MEKTASYPCPCCGYYTFEDVPRGSYLTCPICFWADDLPETFWPQTYLDALREAQRNFLAIGAAAPEFRGDVRPPGPDDRRVSNWQPLDIVIEVERAAVIEQIERAFDGVQREDGVTLHEADVIDVYGSDEERAAARRLDPDRHWQDVPETVLARLSGMSFLDPKGYRYYLPAYMRWMLNHPDVDSNSQDSTIYSLTQTKGLEEWELARWRMLNDVQAAAVCRFLRFLVAYSRSYFDDRHAQLALDEYWGRFCHN